MSGDKRRRCTEQLFIPGDASLQCLRDQSHDGACAFQDRCPTCGQTRQHHEHKMNGAEVVEFVARSG